MCLSCHARNLPRLCPHCQVKRIAQLEHSPLSSVPLSSVRRATITICSARLHQSSKHCMTYVAAPYSLHCACAAHEHSAHCATNNMCTWPLCKRTPSLARACKRLRPMMQMRRAPARLCRCCLLPDIRLDKHWRLRRSTCPNMQAANQTGRHDAGLHSAQHARAVRYARLRHCCMRTARPSGVATWCAATAAHHTFWPARCCPRRRAPLPPRRRHAAWPAVLRPAAAPL